MQTVTEPATVELDPSDLLFSAESVDALPVTVGRLAALVADGDADLLEMVEVVSLDQALTANLLRRANSAAVRGRSEIRTVRDAVVRLGASSVLSMAIAASVSFRLQRPLPAYGLAAGQLWRQSVAASITADVVRRRARTDVPLEAATAALLHDFGKVVLSSHLGPQVLDLLAVVAEAEGSDVVQAERTVFGVTHAEIGGLVAARWKLPPSIVEAITRHHDAGGDLDPVSATVSLAHAMVPAVITHPDDVPAGTVPVTESHGALFDVLALAPEEYDELVDVARGKYDELAARYSVS